MHIKRGVLCRRDGYIYVQLTVDSIRPDTHLVSSAFTKYGSETPSMIFPYGTDDHVLCLAALNVDQRVTIDERDASGGIVARGEISIGVLESKIISKLDNQLKPIDAFHINAWHTKFQTERTRIFLDGGFMSDAGITMRGSICIPSLNASKVTVRLYDQHGVKIEGAGEAHHGKRTIMPGTDDISCTEFPFSVDIPPIRQDYYIFATAPGHPEFASFIVLTAPDYDKMVETGGRYYPGEHMYLPRRLADLKPSADLDPDYDKWFAKHRITDAELEHQRNAKLNGPKFSIIVPLYYTPVELFKPMANSATAQSYENWELILVNSTPDDNELHEVVAQYAKEDPRIRVVELDRNYGITGNTNYGVDAATGDYVSFFDHDDVLEPNILFEYASAIIDDPEIGLLYCDEDKLTDEGVLISPNFKPDFSIDQLRNNNYICHMLTVRKSLLDLIGHTPEGFDGAQDHWLTLRVSEETDRIHHVPKVLYHWRATADSTAMNASNKSYATDSGIRAVQSNLDRLGIDGKVDQYGRAFTYRVRYATTGNPKAAIIVPVTARSKMLEACVRTIVDATAYPNYEIILAHSTGLQGKVADVVKALDGFADRVHTVAFEDTSEPGLVNRAVAKTDAEYVVILDPHVTIDDPEWLSIMVGCCTREEVGAVAPRILKSDYTYYHAGLALTEDGIARLFVDLHRDLALRYYAYPDITRNVSALDDICLVTRKSVFQAVEGLNEGMSGFLAGVDYCLKLGNAGLLCVYTTDITVWYESLLEDKSRASENVRTPITQEERTLMDKWPEAFSHDPFYNPNLCQERPGSQYYLIGD